MVIELKTAEAKSLWVLSWRTPRKSKTRLSMVAFVAVGATPPSQLAPVVQLLFSPMPFQTNVAGARRSSNCSNLKKLRGGLLR